MAFDDETRCFICGDSNPNVLEKHHLIPKRFGGENGPNRIVTLCSNCHAAVEKLYDRTFFSVLWQAYDRLDSFPLGNKKSRPPHGMKWRDDELVPDRGNGFEEMVRALEMREAGFALELIEDETGIPKSTISDNYAERFAIYEPYVDRSKM